MRKKEKRKDEEEKGGSERGDEREKRFVFILLNISMYHVQVAQTCFGLKPSSVYIQTPKLTDRGKKNGWRRKRKDRRREKSTLYCNSVAYASVPEFTSREGQVPIGMGPKNSMGIFAIDHSLTSTTLLQYHMIAHSLCIKYITPLWPGFKKGKWAQIIHVQTAKQTNN